MKAATNDTKNLQSWGGGKGSAGSAVDEQNTIRVVNASRKNIGLPLVIRAARLKEWRGYACLSGVEYDISTGYTAR